MISTMRFSLHSIAGYESVCDGVGVTGRHADRSRESCGCSGGSRLLARLSSRAAFAGIEVTGWSQPPVTVRGCRGHHLTRQSRSNAAMDLLRRRSSSPYVVNFLCCRAVMLEQVYVELNPLGRRNYPPCWRQGPTHPLIRGGMG